MQKITFKINPSLLTIPMLDSLMKDAARLYCEARAKGDSVMRRLYMDAYESLSDEYCKMLTNKEESTNAKK